MPLARVSAGVLTALLCWSVAPLLEASQQRSVADLLSEGLGALQSGEPRRARQLFELVLAEQPRHGPARYELGRLAFERGHLEEASEHLEIAAAADFPRQFAAQNLLGRTLLLQRRFEAALTSFAASSARAPRFAPALLGRAEGLLYLGRVEEGMTGLQAARELSGAASRASVLLGQLLVFMERGEEAREVLEEVVEAGDSAAGRWKRPAELLRMSVADPVPAIHHLENALSEGLSEESVYWALAVASLRAGNRARAASLLLAALHLEAENPVTLLMLQGISERSEQPAALPGIESAIARAVGAWEEGRYDEAVGHASSLLRARPSLVPAQLILLRDAQRRRDLWQALVGYEELLDRLGSIPSLAESMAGVAQTMGAHELALCGARQALSHRPEQGSLHYLMAVILADLGDTEAALVSCRRAIELGYRDVRVWLKLGELHFQRMEISASIGAYEKAVEEDPAAAEAIGSYVLSNLTVDQYEALRELLEKHVEAHPDNVNTLYTLGVMSLRENDLQKAQRYFERLAEISPQRRHQVHYNLGQIYSRQGRREEGKREMELFSELKAAEDEKWERHNKVHFRRLEASEAVASGSPERAIQLYLETIADGTAEVLDYLELGAACEKAGDPEKALVWYREVLEFYPYHRQALEGVASAAAALGSEELHQDAQRKLEILDWPCQERASAPAASRAPR